MIFLLEVFSCHQLENDLIRSSHSNLAIRMKLKRSKSSGFSPPKYSICTKTVRRNKKQLICKQCFE